MKGWLAFAALLVAVLVWATVERTVDGAQRARYDGERRQMRHTADSLRNRNALAELEAEAEADSLRSVVNGFRRKTATLMTRSQSGHNRAQIGNDTVLVPDTVWRYLTDTVLPRCEACAARLDSLVAQHRQEREANERYGAGLQSEIAHLRPRAEFGPRVRVYAEGLRDMVSGLPSVAGGAELRLLGRIYLTGRVEQRLVMGDTVRASLGVRLVF